MGKSHSEAAAWRGNHVSSGLEAFLLSGIWKESGSKY